MYEAWLVMNVAWEIATDNWPWIAALVALWVGGMWLAKPLPFAAWKRAFMPALAAALALGAGIFAISPSITQSSFANVSYWIDWANLIGFAVGCTMVVFSLIWPWAVWFKAQRTSMPQAMVQA